MESRLLLVNNNNNNKQRCYNDQQQLTEIHRLHKIAPSSKRSKRSAMKRVVSIPIKGAENARGNNKSGDGAPPADCWAWRKYGQKPIKGSPYPRGYYRCSSSKGCPARKQVERSHADPTMLVITYSSDHNHSLPGPSRNQSTTVAATTDNNNENSESSAAADKAAISNNSVSKSTESGEAEEQKQVEESLLTMEDDFGWLTGLESAPSFMMMDSAMFGDDLGGGGNSMMMPVMGEEDLSLFADLGELPECSTVFRRKAAAEEIVTFADATWFKTTS
ncbi:hypothetical protein QQ045_032369 [Rhodiola kirilowii]